MDDIRDEAGNHSGIPGGFEESERAKALAKVVSSAHANESTLAWLFYRSNIAQEG